MMTTQENILGTHMLAYKTANNAPKFAGYAGGTAKELRSLLAPWLKR